MRLDRTLSWRGGRLRPARGPRGRCPRHRERAAARAGSDRLAATLVRPLRREIESFRFSTVRLDIRQNSDKINAALGQLWATAQRRRAAGVRLDRLARLAAGRACAAPRRRLPPLGAAGRPGRDRSISSRLVRETQENRDRDAFGCFILSMTRRASDLLGVYLLAKEAGLYADRERVEVCTLPGGAAVRDHRRPAAGAGDPAGADGGAGGRSAASGPWAACSKS